MPIGRGGCIGQCGINAPDAPTIGAVTSGIELLSVAFTAPSCVGGSAVTQYVARAVDACGNSFSGANSASPVVIACLTNCTTYSVSVLAKNTYGTSGYSASVCGTPSLPIGQQAYTCAGSYCWTAPLGVTAVSVVAVGGGGGVYQTPGSTSTRYPGGGGGGLGYKNNISVIPGCSYSVVVGANGPGGTVSGAGTQNASASYFINACTVRGGGGAGADSTLGGGSGRQGGGFAGDGGSNGGNGGSAGSGGGGGGGAAGYGPGNGGNGGNGGGSPGCAGVNGGGGGGGGGTSSGAASGGAGGGVGILGAGSNGAGGAVVSGQQPFAGCGGSGGGGGGQQNSCGGYYGGGGGWTYYSSGAGKGGGGAVRIIWPGNTRQFPSTCTGNL